MKRVLRWTSLALALISSSALCALLVGLRRFERLVRRDVEALLDEESAIGVRRWG